VALALALQASAFAALLAADRWLAVAAGRVTFARRGVPPARPDGLGALVAGTQAPTVSLGWGLVLLGGALAVVPSRPWQGVVAVLLAAAGVGWLSRHTTRRFGGLVGDVLGAASETATTVFLVLRALG